MSEREARQQVSRSLILLAALALGLAAGVLLIPAAFRLIPNDLSRVRTVLLALRGNPQIVVIGDSRGEASIDARQLTAELPQHPLVYNLSWHALRLVHVYALADRFPPSVRTVVINVSLQDLADDGPGEPRIWEAMRAYGYEPDPRLVAEMRRAFRDDPLLQPLMRPPLQARLTSRWAIRQIADTGLRSLFRRDLRFERERDDLFFPSAYTRRAAPAAFESFFATHPNRIGSETICPAKKILLAHIVRTARARRWRVVLLLPAVHPRLMLADHDRRVAELRAYGAGTGMEIVDGGRWLNDADFNDPLHPSIEGARKFTAALAAALQGRG